jgi:hypothetical protein
MIVLGYPEASTWCWWRRKLSHQRTVSPHLTCKIFALRSSQRAFAHRYTPGLLGPLCCPPSTRPVVHSGRENLQGYSRMVNHSQNLMERDLPTQKACEENLPKGPGGIAAEMFYAYYEDVPLQPWKPSDSRDPLPV